MVLLFRLSRIPGNKKSVSAKTLNQVLAKTTLKLLNQGMVKRGAVLRIKIEPIDIEIC